MPWIDLARVDTSVLLDDMGGLPDANLIRRAVTALLAREDDAFFTILKDGGAEAWATSFFLACLGAVVRERFGPVDREILIQEAASIASRQLPEGDDPPTPVWKIESALRIVAGEPSIARELDAEDLLEGTALALGQLLQLVDTEPGVRDRVLNHVLHDLEVGMTVIAARAPESGS